MRGKIAQYKGKTLRLSGILIEMSFAQKANQFTALIKPVKNNGYVITDHAWITIGDSFKNIEIDKFDVIEFDAIVEEYVKHDDKADYGFRNISNIRIIKKGDGYDYISRMQEFHFQISDEMRVKIYGENNKIVRQDFSKKLENGISIYPGEKVTCKFVKVHNGYLEFKLRTEHMSVNEWITQVYFNPMKNSQSLSVRGVFSIYIPHDIYSNLKRAYFKVFCTKTNLLKLCG